MLGRFSWIALGLGTYLVFVMVLFPASVAYRWFAPDSVRLSGIEGTVWAGNAILGSVGNVGFYDLEWRLRPWYAVFLQVGGQLQARLADGFLSTTVQAGLTQMTLTELQATVSLAGLRDLLPLGAMQGLVSAQFERLRIENEWPVEAIGEVRVGELGVPPMMIPGGELLELGNYRVRFSSTQSADLVGSFENQGGPLEATGSLRFSPNRAYAIEGVARARPGAPPELVQGLEIMTASPDASGLRAFDFSGSL